MDRGTRQEGKPVVASPSNSRSLLFSLFTLTFVTGLVDAVSFLGLGHVFTANMTGNVVFLGFAVAGAPGLSIPRSLTSLIAFLVGAVFGGRLGLVMGATNQRRWLITVAAIEAVLLLAATLGSIGFDFETGTPLNRLYLVIILTALAMGVRNATVRRLAVPDMTTTVLTLTLTGIAADSWPAGGTNTRIGRRTASVLLMFLGAAIGALLLTRGASLALGLSCICVLSAAASYALLPPSASPSEGERSQRR